MEKRVVFKSRWLPWMLLIPQLAVIGIFFFWPAAQAIRQSLLLEDPFGMSSQFVGLANFRQLWEDASYVDSFRITAEFSILVAGLGIGLALILAVFADRIVKGATLYKTLMIVPYAIAPVLAGVLWAFMFSPTIGNIPWLLRKLHMNWDYLVNAGQAKWLVVMAAVWKQISYNFLFFLAGLQTIPKSLIEAAAIDGAGPLRRFWTIQFPLLSPTTFYLLVMNVVYAFFDTFALIDATTQGGPGQSTNILVYKVYMDGFKNLNLGGSAAQSVVLMFIVVLLTVFQFRFVEKRVQY